MTRHLRNVLDTEPMQIDDAIARLRAAFEMYATQSALDLRLENNLYVTPRTVLAWDAFLAGAAAALAPEVIRP